MCLDGPKHKQDDTSDNNRVTEHDEKVEEGNKSTDNVSHANCEGGDVRLFHGDFFCGCTCVYCQGMCLHEGVQELNPPILDPCPNLR